MHTKSTHSPQTHQPMRQPCLETPFMLMCTLVRARAHIHPQTPTLAYLHTPLSHPITTTHSDAQQIHPFTPQTLAIAAIRMYDHLEGCA